LYGAISRRRVLSFAYLSNFGENMPPSKELDNKQVEKIQTSVSKEDNAFATLVREYNAPGTESQRAGDTRTANATLQASGLLPGLTIDGLQSSKPGDGKALDHVTSFATERDSEGLVDGHFKPSDISPSGVDQTLLGDCWFQSAVASMAGSDKGRQQISQMIKGNDDGSYTVTFPGDKDHPVTVSNDEVNENDKIKDSAEWARVLQAAILKKNPDQANNGSHNIKGDLIVDHGGDKLSLQLLTGQNINQDTLFETSDKSRVAHTIEESLQSGQPITASTSDSPEKPLSSNHVYTVTGYDPKTGMVTLRNPWGNNGDFKPGTDHNGMKISDDGTVQMSMDSFLKNYNYLQYAGQPKSQFQQIGQVASNITNMLNPFNW